MLKKIRCFYWNMRDQGKGRQVKMFAFVLCLALLSMVGLVGKSLVDSHRQPPKVSSNQGDREGATKGAIVVTEGAVSLDLGSEEKVLPGVSIEAPIQDDVDTSELDGFHGFMSDAAYTNLENQMVAECQNRQCKSAKKLNYQITSEGSFDVTSFVLLSDGSVYESDYNLESEAITVNQTTYVEADIQRMNEEAQKAAQEALEKQQKADQKKAEATKKKAKAAKKKKAKRKKSQLKKTKSIKKTQSGKKKQ